MLGRLLNFPPTLARPLRSNFSYLLWDAAWWSLYVGSTGTFLTIYASRIGATSQQIGLLTAIPALIALLISLPLGQWLRRFPAKPATVWSAFSFRMIFALYPLLPQFLPVNRQYSAILLLICIITVPSTVLNISFTQFFMDAVPSEWRGAVIGGRGAIGAIVSLTATLLCGQILTHLRNPLNYQVVFALGFIGAIMTVYQMIHIHKVDPGPGEALLLDPSTVASGQPALAQKSRFFPRIEGQGRIYLRVIGLLFLLTLFSNAAAPLVPNLLVQRLKLSDEWISFGASTNTLVVLLVSLFIARITRRTGNRRATSASIGLHSTSNIILSLAQGPAFYLVSAVIAGVAGGVSNVAQNNYFIEHIPSTEKPGWISINVLLGSIGLLLGALGGPLMASGVGTPAAMILFGGLELGVGVVILKWG